MSSEIRRAPRALPSRLRHLLSTLRHSQAGISVVEFALCLPMLVTVGMVGIEIAYMATVNMQVSQLALSVADNASRLGQTDNSATTPTVAETDIDAVMFGAIQQGTSLNFEQNGRIVLSSLEVNEGIDPDDDDDDFQYLHWQRCAGDLEVESSYGEEGDEVSGVGEENLTANKGQAVMFAEVSYTYQPIFAGLVLDGLTFKQEAAFIARDDRNLDGGGGDGLTGTANSTC